MARGGLGVGGIALCQVGPTVVHPKQARRVAPLVWLGWGGGWGGGRSEAEARAAPSPPARSLLRDHNEIDDLAHDASAACFAKVHRQPVSYAKSFVKKGHVLGLRNTRRRRCHKGACACVSHFVTPFNRLNFI